MLVVYVNMCYYIFYCKNKVFQLNKQIAGEPVVIPCSVSHEFFGFQLPKLDVTG